MLLSLSLLPSQFQYNSFEQLWSVSSPPCENSLPPAPLSRAVLKWLGGLIHFPCSLLLSSCLLFSINFVNEKLQQIFIELTLKAEQEEYASGQPKHALAASQRQRHPFGV